MCSADAPKMQEQREDQCLEVNLGTKSILAGRDAAALLTTKHSTGLRCPAHDRCCSEHLQRQEKRSSACARLAQGWTEQECREGWKTQHPPQELSRSVCFTAELLSGCEKLLISKEGRKAVRENHPLPHHSPSSTSVASSSFRGLCRHHSQDPENFT